MQLWVLEDSWGNSAQPDLMPDSSQCVLEGRRGLGLIPGAIRERLVVTGFDEPCPDQGIDRISDRGDPFRPMVPPGLRLLDSQKLLYVPECVLDRPPVRESGDQQGRGKLQISGEEEVVLLNAGGIARDDQENIAAWQDRVPDDPSNVDKSGPDLSSLHRFHRSPFFGGASNLGRGWEARPSAGPGSTFPVNWRRSFPVERSIASNPADDMRPGGLPSSKGSIEAIPDEIDLAFWEPSDGLLDHFLHQVEHRLSDLLVRPFPIQSHVDGQGQRLAAPRRSDLHAQQDELEAPGVDDALRSRANRITTVFCSGDLSARLLVNGVIANQPEVVGVSEQPDDQDGEGVKECPRGPGGGPEETMISIVSVFSPGIAEMVDRSHKPPTGTENPAFDNVEKQSLTGFCKNRKKPLYKNPNLGYSEHDRSSSVKMRLASHLHCSRGTALSGTGSYQNVRKSTCYIPLPSGSMNPLSRFMRTAAVRFVHVEGSCVNPFFSALPSGPCFLPVYSPSRVAVAVARRVRPGNRRRPKPPFTN